MGLARQQRAAAHHLTVVTMVAGTHGFIDDYYQNTGKFDASADGYAMGVAILMVLTKLPAFVPHEGRIVARCLRLSEERVVAIADADANWPAEVAIAVHSIGMDPVKDSRRDRIIVNEALDRLQTIFDDHVLHAPPAANNVERQCLYCMVELRQVRFDWCVQLYCKCT